MELLLYFGIPMLASFLFQLRIGNRTKRCLLRHVPLYFAGMTLLFAGISLTADTGFLIGGNVIAAAVWGSLGGCILLGYVVALLAGRAKK